MELELGKPVDTSKLIKLSGNTAPLGQEYSEYSRWKVRPQAKDLFGTGYVITGKKKVNGQAQEILLGFSNDHDLCITQMKKFVKVQYKPYALEHLLP